MPVNHASDIAYIMLQCRGAFRLSNIRSAIVRPSSCKGYTERQFSSRAQILYHSYPRPPRSQWPCAETKFRLLPSSIPQKRLQSTFFKPSSADASSTPQLGVNSASTTDIASESLPELSWVPPEVTDDRYIGYLKDLGLDFGWGPTSIMQWVFEHIHVFAYTPVWGSVILLAVIYRTAIFRLLQVSSENSARMKAMQPVVKPIMDKMKAAQAAGDQMEATKRLTEMRNVWKEADVKFTRMILPFLQIPFGFGVWRLLRNMAFIPVPELATGGALWFQDLALPDPYFVLPCVTAACMFIQFRIGGETGAQTNVNPLFLNLFKWVLPCVTPFIFARLAALVQLSFAVNAVFALFTAFLLRSNAFRKMLKMTPMITEKPQAPKTPPMGFWKGVSTHGFTGYISKQGKELANSGMMSPASKATQKAKLERQNYEKVRSKTIEEARRDYEQRVQNALDGKRQQKLVDRSRGVRS